MNNEVIDLLKFGSLDLDLKTGIMKWSKELFQFFKITQNDDTVLSFNEIIKVLTDKDKEVFSQAVSRIINFGEAYDLDLEVLTENGNLMYLHALGNAKVEDGKIISIFGTFQNITKRKITEIKKEIEIIHLNDAQKLSKTGSWEFNLSSYDQSWSKEHFRIFEIDENIPNDQLHKEYRSKIHPDDLIELDRVVEEAKVQGKGFTYDHRVILDNGNIKYVRGVGIVSLDSCGKPTKLSGICRDMTEEKAKDIEIKLIVDSLEIGIWKFDPITNELEWDNSMYVLFGQDPKEFSGAYSAWENALTSEAKEFAIIDLKMALSGEKDFNTTFEILLKNGEKRNIAGQGIVVRNEKQEPIKMYGINWDVTERMQSEKKWFESQQLLSIVLDTLPIAVFAKDIKDDFKFTVWNKFTENLLDLKKESVLGKSDYDFFSKERADKFREKDLIACETYGIVDTPEEYIETSSGIKAIHTRKIVIRDQVGDPNFLICISEDLTEQKKLEEETRRSRLQAINSSKLASLGEMSAGIAHEINNPLAIISASVEQLKRSVSDPAKFDERIKMIDKSVNRISKIITGLRKFSRSSENPSSLKNHSVSAIIQEVLTLVESKSKTYDTTITFECLHDVIWYCDEIEIEQVLVNLINNAIDAVKLLDEKWVKILLTQKEQYASIQITDSGFGIPEMVKNKLFEPFFTTKNIGEGTGLGLSITKGILEQHKASIYVDSKGPNTCFVIQFNT